MTQNMKGKSQGKKVGKGGSHQVLKVYLEESLKARLQSIKGDNVKQLG